jgi:hypothetical protein
MMRKINSKIIAGVEKSHPSVDSLRLYVEIFAVFFIVIITLLFERGYQIYW